MKFLFINTMLLFTVSSKVQGPSYVRLSPHILP